MNRYLFDAEIQSVYARFQKTAGSYPERPFLNVIEETARIYQIDGGEISYARMRERVEELRKRYAAAGYGLGHRIGLLLENRPAFFEHWFALNAVGASVVPINPDLRSAELEYLIGHSEQVLAICIPSRQKSLVDVAISATPGFCVIGPDDEIPSPTTPARAGSIASETEAALLYTSGTTGLPKGCVLSNRYFLLCGDQYYAFGGYCAFHHNGERMISPLPLFHMNAMACSTLVMLCVGGCLTVLDRFHPRTWWDSVRETKASVIHYLGVMPAMLLSLDEAATDRDHQVRFGFGAGVDGKLHQAFEDRFGFPLVEGWGMTETGHGRSICAAIDPRHVGANCFGAPRENVDVRIEKDNGEEAAPGEQGELLVRAPGSDPRDGFFSYYLKDEAATEDAWSGGWFHSGDIVSANADGTVRFIDRKKNVIRRSGENIAAIEVEGVLNQHPKVEIVAVAATPDDIRGDEVLALVQLIKDDDASSKEGLAEELCDWCLERLAYYKAPGYVAFVPALPLTSTNKVKRGDVVELAKKIRTENAFVDLRYRKKRTTS